jgi:hypothetical protein
MQALLSFEKLLTVVHHTSIQNEEYISIHAEILLITFNNHLGKRNFAGQKENFFSKGYLKKKQ